MGVLAHVFGRTKKDEWVLKMPLSSNLLDISGWENNGIAIGTETHLDGGLKTSTGNYAYAPSSTTIDIGTGSISFGCRVKFGSITGFKGIIGRSITGPSLGRYSIHIESNLIYFITQLTSGQNTNTKSTVGYNDGNFHNMLCVCDRTLGVQKIYIDDVFVNQVTFTPSITDVASSTRFYIGAYGSSGLATSPITAGTELNGIIKNVFVVKKVITVAESKSFLDL